MVAACGVAAHPGATVRAADVVVPDGGAPWTVPVVPPKCSAAQIAALDVADCVLLQRGEPPERGWGTPPFPTPGGPGWRWLGYAYDGSPALAAWESEQLATVGRLRANVAVVALFNGFLAEITAGGYRVGDVGGYSFRCTSGSGKTCEGLDPSSLSNHAWGLALDMNTAANPELTYRRTDGVTACAVPMRTDIPQWVVRTAQRWGLYWGGYGWSGGCAGPTTERDSISRDPMHFEFRGDVATALALASARGVPVPPIYCTTTTDTRGKDARSCSAAGLPGTGWRTPVATGAPPGAIAVLANITAVGATGTGYLVAEPCVRTATGDRTTSNVNYTAGTDTANLSIVPVDQAGRFCLWRSSPVHTLVDVQGYVVDPAKVADPTARAALTSYRPVTPWRAADSRSQGACDPAGTCTTGAARPDSIAATTIDGAPAGAVAVTANLTVVHARDAGYVTADRCSVMRPGTQDRSNANHPAGGTVANLAVVPLDVEPAGQRAMMCTYTSAGGDLVTDVQGFHVPGSAGLRYALAAPRRVLDTRSCLGAVGGRACSTRVGDGQVVEVDLGSTADVVAVNLTITDATAAGYASIGDCATLRAGVPTTSNDNYVAGTPRANLALVARSASGTCVWVQSAAHVIVDVQGELRADATSLLATQAPRRVLDTRRPG